MENLANQEPINFQSTKQRICTFFCIRHELPRLPGGDLEITGNDERNNILK